MADAESLELGEKFPEALRAHVVHVRTAVGRDNLEARLINLQEAGDEAAFPLLEVPEHADFVLKPGVSLRPTEGLVDQPVVADADQGAVGVFDLVHGVAKPTIQSLLRVARARWLGCLAARRPDTCKTRVWRGKSRCFWHVRC